MLRYKTQGVNLPSYLQSPHILYVKKQYFEIRLAIEPAWLGSAQLELARYGNELARLGSLPDRAESQARLGSFSSSSQLVWLVSQLEKKNCQLAEPKRRATS